MMLEKFWMENEEGIHCSPLRHGKSGGVPGGARLSAVGWPHQERLQFSFTHIDPLGLWWTWRGAGQGATNVITGLGAGVLIVGAAPILLPGATAAAVIGGLGILGAGSLGLISGQVLTGRSLSGKKLSDERRSALAVEALVGWVSLGVAAAAQSRAAVNTTEGITPTPRQTIQTENGPVTIPPGYVPRPADSGKGIVYQPPGADGNKNAIRVMDPTPDSPNGYVIVYDKQGHPIDIQSGGVPRSRGGYHNPIK